MEYTGEAASEATGEDTAVTDDGGRRVGSLEEITVHCASCGRDISEVPAWHLSLFLSSPSDETGGVGAHLVYCGQMCFERQASVVKRFVAQLREQATLARRAYALLARKVAFHRGALQRAQERQVALEQEREERRRRRENRGPKRPPGRPRKVLTEEQLAEAAAKQARKEERRREEELRQAQRREQALKRVEERRKRLARRQRARARKRRAAEARKAQRAERLATVARMCLEGHKYADIAMALGLSPARGFSLVSLAKAAGLLPPDYRRNKRMGGDEVENRGD